MPGRSLDNETEARIFKDYENGVGGTRTLVKKYNTTRTVIVGAIRRQRELAEHGSKPIPLYKQKDWLVEQYIKNKLGTSEIAQLAGCGKTAVLYWMDKYGIERRGNSDAHLGAAGPGKIILPPDEERKLVSLYADGRSGHSLADEFGLSQQVVYRILHEHDMVRVSKKDWCTLDGQVFDCIDSESAAYWYGFIYADGCVYRNALRVLLKQSDSKHLVKLCQFLKSDRPVLKYERRQYNKTYGGEDYAVVIFGSKHMAEVLVNLGIVKERPNIKPVIDSVPQYLVRHWIRGYFDGDGCASKNRCTISFIGQRDLLKWISSEIGRSASTNPRKLRSTKSDFMFAIRYSGAFVCKRVTNFMYKDATIWMDRKKGIVESWSEPKQRRRDDETGRFIKSV